MPIINEHHDARARYDHLLRLISSRKFLDMTGPSNEVPYYICPFKVEETQTVYQYIVQLKNALELKQVRTLEINLYHLTIEHLKSINVLDTYIQNEPNTPKEKFFKSLSGITDAEEFICPLILNEIESEDHDVVFITGVGEVFPYIRSHKILSTLESKYTECPLVLFFPGTYETDNIKGSNLTLFGILDDKYYRAFNIYHCGP